MNPLSGPIPGQSLTTEPGNTPWEQPPLYSKPSEALNHYIEKFQDESTVEDLLFLLEQDLPLETFVDSVTTTGVMEGYHSIDISTLIQPVLHTYIKEMADSAGIEYTEWAGPSYEEEMKKKDKTKLSLSIARELEKGQEKEEEVAPEEPTEAPTGFIERRA